MKRASDISEGVKVEGVTITAKDGWPLQGEDSAEKGEETEAVRRLLVVDDDPGFGELVRKLGVKLEFEVEVTSNGEAFMQAYDSFRPSVVMLDMIMPDIEGIELIEWLGERGADAHVIVVTGFWHRYAAMAKTMAEARNLRFVACLSKPVTLNDMRTALTGTIECCPQQS